MKRLAALLITLAVLATACGGNVFELAVGDCFNDPDLTSEVTDVEMVDCGEPHDNEVYATFDVAGSDFPGDGAVQNEAQEGCVAAFDAYVGLDFISSSLDISALTPTQQSWDQGDQEVVCFLFDLDRNKLSQTAKDSGI